MDKLCGKVTFQQQKTFLYAAYREQFIELIEAQESQKAFTHLTKRLKPLEAAASSLGEFKDLCYLLTCRSVHEVLPTPKSLPNPRITIAPLCHCPPLSPLSLRLHPGPSHTPSSLLGAHPPQVLPHWPGAATAREGLLAQFATMMELEERRPQERDTESMQLPPRRLLTLLEQAAAYQVDGHAHATPATPPATPSDAATLALAPIGASAGACNGAPAGGECHATAAVAGTSAAGGAGAGVAAVGGEGRVTSLLRDYMCVRVPNASSSVLCGHSSGVKSVAWVRQTSMLLSGGNDHAVRLWSAREHGECVALLEGHTARVWQLAVSQAGSYAVACAAADGNVLLWRLSDELVHGSAATGGRRGARGLPADGGGVDGARAACVAPSGTLTGHVGDVYTVDFHPYDPQIVTAGYDKTCASRHPLTAHATHPPHAPHLKPTRPHPHPSTQLLTVAFPRLSMTLAWGPLPSGRVRLFDVALGVEQRVLTGHELPARQAVFSATGTLVVSGGKDSTVRFWDVRSALCVRKLHHSLGEVTSVQLSPCGTQLLASSKDNSIRLWDVRAARPLRAFKGHQNTSKNFVRARFGPARDLVVSGSEVPPLWDALSKPLPCHPCPPAPARNVRCLRTLAASCRRLPIAARRCPPLPTAAHRCPPLRTAAHRCPPLPTAASSRSDRARPPSPLPLLASALARPVAKPCPARAHPRPTFHMPSPP